MNFEPQIIDIDGIYIELLRKNIKNIHLRVFPPLGAVRVSAPVRMDAGTVKKFCASKIGWIRKQQEKMKARKYEPAREYVSGENHFFLGEKCLLGVIEGKGARKVVLHNGVIHMHIRQGEGKKKRKAILEKWYKKQLKEAVFPHIERLEKAMNVKVEKLVVRTMKTRWGTCNSRTNKICLNTELAKKPFESIEYVLIHEMAHLLERGHQKKFKAVMEKFLPEWRRFRKELRSEGTGL